MIFKNVLILLLGGAAAISLQSSEAGGPACGCCVPACGCATGPVYTTGPGGPGYVAGGPGYGAGYPGYSGSGYPGGSTTTCVTQPHSTVCLPTPPPPVCCGPSPTTSITLEVPTSGNGGCGYSRPATSIPAYVVSGSGGSYGGGGGGNGGGGSNDGCDDLARKMKCLNKNICNLSNKVGDYCSSDSDCSCSDSC